MLFTQIQTGYCICILQFKWNDAVIVFLWTSKSFDIYNSLGKTLLDLSLKSTVGKMHANAAKLLESLRRIENTMLLIGMAMRSPKEERESTRRANLQTLVLNCCTLINKTQLGTFN